MISESSRDSFPAWTRRRAAREVMSLVQLARRKMESRVTGWDFFSSRWVWPEVWEMSSCGLLEEVADQARRTIASWVGGDEEVVLSIWDLRVDDIVEFGCGVGGCC